MFWWDRAWYFLLLHCAQRKSRRDMYLALLWFACAQLMAQGAWRRKFVSEMSLRLRLHLPGLSLPISPSSIDGCQRCAEPALPSPPSGAKVRLLTSSLQTGDRDLFVFAVNISVFSTWQHQRVMQPVEGVIESVPCWCVTDIATGLQTRRFRKLCWSFTCSILHI